MTSLAARARQITIRPELPHALMVALCAGALLLAFVLEPARPGAEVVSIQGIPIPPICSMKRMGIDCPGCGLTRSWVSAAHGQFSDSLGYHRLGWLVMVYALFQFLRHALWLGLPSGRPRIDRMGKKLDNAALVLAALLLANWGLELALGL